MKEFNGMFLNLVLVSLLLWQTIACPNRCTCSLDHKGRKTVQCLKGGLVGPINLDGVGLDTEVIKITAPEDNMNELTMSPIFQSYKKLEEIHVTRSNIPQLGMHFFWGLTRLDVLNLSQNNITQPLDHNFRGLLNLKELYLDDNRIHSLPSGTFRYLQELKLLSIQRNRITELMPRIFMEIGKLKFLKLSGNNLKELNPEVFKDVQDLRSLECRGCALKIINNEIYHLLPNLIYLDLGDNEFKNVTSNELQDLTSLKILKLDGNQITAITSSTFVNQPSLKKLNLARNEISKMSGDAFRDLHNLTELDLSYNKLERIENTLFDPVSTSLEVLILSGNHIKLQNLQQLLHIDLKELRLADCGIADIPVQIFPESLNLLDLSRNHLTTISNHVMPGNLVELDIHKNRFRGIDEEIISKVDKIKILRLEQNQWSCDLCHIIPLIERVNRSTIYQNIVCQHPYTVEGKKLSQIQRSELTWCTASSYTSSDANFFLLGEDGKVGVIAAGMSVCLLGAVIIAIIAALCYSRRHAAKYYTHEDKLAMDGEAIFDNHSPLFCDGELSFKFPLDNAEKKLSVSTIEEIKKEHTITNGT